MPVVGAVFICKRRFFRLMEIETDYAALFRDVHGVLFTPVHGGLQIKKFENILTKSGPTKWVKKVLILFFLTFLNMVILIFVAFWNFFCNFV